MWCDEWSTQQALYDEFKNVVDTVADSKMKTNIKISGFDNEKLWENIYLAVQLLHANEDMVRIYLGSSKNDCFDHCTFLAHLEDWIKHNEGNRARILFQSNEDSRIHSRFKELVESGRVALKVLNSNTEHHGFENIGLFGNNGFKMGMNTEKDSVFLGNFSAPNDISILAEEFDKTFESDVLSRELQGRLSQLAQRFFSGFSDSPTPKIVYKTRFFDQAQKIFQASSRWGTIERPLDNFLQETTRKKVVCPALQPL